jgi:alpha-methylacyl-CoA racemase
MSRSGPLKGVRIVEFSGIGPGPMCGMLLSDMGADVAVIDRLEPSGLGVPRAAKYDVSRRGRRSVALDLKHPEGIAAALDLVRGADALIEGFRPGTMERLGLGPDVCLKTNAKLVYGRITGWGQDGPLAQSAGHDLNYIALSGALAAIGKKGEAPTIPLNLIGDFGGGGMLLALGMLAAIIEAKTSGQGQVVDAAMAEGAAMLLGPFFGMLAAGVHSLERGSNLLDGGAPFYDVYECKDGGCVSLGPVEGKFQRVMLERLGFDPADFPDMKHRANWPAAREKIAARVRQKTRDEWCAILEGSDACFAPVLDMREAPQHAHFKARGSFVDIDGVTQPAPVPRFSRTQAAAPAAFAGAGTDGRGLLLNWGFEPARIDALQAQGVIGAPKGD